MLHGHTSLPRLEPHRIWRHQLLQVGIYRSSKNGRKCHLLYSWWAFLLTLDTTLDTNAIIAGITFLICTSVVVVLIGKHRLDCCRQCHKPDLWPASGLLHWWHCNSIDIQLSCIAEGCRNTWTTRNHFALFRASTISTTPQCRRRGHESAPTRIL